MEILHIGSVKTVIKLKERRWKEFFGGLLKECKIIDGLFDYSDAYSVFDYGKMPDMIPNKGSSLCMTSAYFFELFEFELFECYGIKTHYNGLALDDEGKIKTFTNASKPVNKMIVRLFDVYKPKLEDGKYDYSCFTTELTNYLIPLEVIYRNYLGEGSSVFRRLKNNELRLEELGLTDYPVVGKRLEKPIIEFSTKLEEKDRMLKCSNEAQMLSGLTDKEFDELIKTTLKINEVITKCIEKKNLDIKHEDGKLEFALDENRALVLVDAVGTLDECRYNFNGISLSKEILRQYYEKTDWAEAVRDAKKQGSEWRNFCPEPPRLPQELVRLVSSIYMSFCNLVVGKRLFAVDELPIVMERYKAFNARGG